MRYGSVCSGIEAATVAWHPLGWRPAFFAEIDKFPSAVLQAHYPRVPNLGDFTNIQPDQHDPIEILVGGTPCQSFSVAGLRGGLADDRGNLALEFLRLAQRARPRWLVWENVPGVLSTNGGRDFGAILGGMVELGYGIAYRVLDAQFIRVDGYRRAVPQRRRRVFIVGYLGDWRRAAAVLFERASLLGDSPPRREAGESVAGSLGGSSQSGGFRTTDLDNQGAFIPELADPVCANEQRTYTHEGVNNFRTRNVVAYNDLEGASHALNGCDSAHGRYDPTVETFIAFGTKDYGQDAQVDVAPTVRAMNEVDGHANGGGQLAVAFESRFVRNGRGAPDVVCPPLKAQSGETGKGDAAPLVAYAFKPSHYTRGKDGAPSDVYPPLAAEPDKGDQDAVILHRWAVRRLTPRECERLQGFPDGYTDVPWRGKNWTPDGPRYKALGNSMAVNCMRWIGRRIAMVDAIKQARAA